MSGFKDWALVELWALLSAIVLFVCWLFCWFVSRITQKLPNRFPRKLVDGWNTRQEKSQELLITSLNIARSGVFF